MIMIIIINIIALLFGGAVQGTAQWMSVDGPLSPFPLPGPPRIPLAPPRSIFLNPLFYLLLRPSSASRSLVNADELLSRLGVHISMAERALYAMRRIEILLRGNLEHAAPSLSRNDDGAGQKVDPDPP